MDEEIMVQGSSVEGGEVANSTEGMDNPIKTEVNTGSEEGIEGQAEVEPNAAQTENSDDDNSGIETSKNFAERLSKKTKAIEAQFQEKYGKYAKVIEREAAKYGMEPEAYLAEIERQDAEEQAEREREADIEKYGDIPPEQLDKIKKADKIIEDQARQEKYNSEAKDFRKTFPDVKHSDIPDEVYAIRELEGCSLTTAYKSYMFEQSQTNKEQLKLESEQAAIKGLLKNQNSTPGSLSKSSPDNSPRAIRDIPDSEFEQMLQDIKRGKSIKI